MRTGEIRQRLKHCAGLLYGLSIDLNHDGEELEALREENQRLKAEIAKLRREKKDTKRPQTAGRKKRGRRVWTEEQRK